MISQNLALHIVIKNTFLDVDESDSAGSPCGSSRRSSSVPCAWRPGYSFDKGRCQRLGSTQSLASTAASDEGASDGQAAPLNDVETQDDMPTKKVSLNPEAAEFQMPVSYEAQAPPKPSSTSGIRLNPEARAFEPMPATPTSPGLPAEISTVINSAKHALMASPHIVNVKVTEGALGQNTTIVAEVNSSAGPYGSRETLNSAKAALLNAAARSQMTYVIGWGTVPFQDLGGDSGFKGLIGSVPMTMQDSVCWDTFQKGYCPRRTLCRWCHPLETDVAPFRVILKRSDTGTDRFQAPHMET